MTTTRASSEKASRTMVRFSTELKCSLFIRYFDSLKLPLSTKVLRQEYYGVRNTLENPER